MRELIALFAALLVICTSISANCSERSFGVQASIPFRITLPGNWKQIPKSVIGRATKRLISNAPKLTALSYDTGFQLSNEKQWFSGPHILVRVDQSNEAETITENDLRDLCSEFDSLSRGVVGDESQALDKIGLSGVSTKTCHYNNTNHTLTYEMDGRAANEEFHSLNTMKFTRTGTISVYCYSRASEYDRYVNQFEQIVQSVSISPELEVQPTRALDNIHRVFWSTSPIIVILIGYLIYKSYSQRRRNRSRLEKEAVGSDCSSGETALDWRLEVHESTKQANESGQPQETQSASRGTSQFTPTVGPGQPVKRERIAVWKLTPVNDSDDSGNVDSRRMEGMDSEIDEKNTRFWYYMKDNQQHGPVSEDELTSRFGHGGLAPDTLVWMKGLKVWTAARDIENLVPDDFTPPPPPSQSSPVLTAASVPAAALKRETSVSTSAPDQKRRADITCSQCGAPNDYRMRVCAKCKTPFNAHPQEQPTDAEVQPGNRFIARWIDLMLFGVFSAMLCAFAWRDFFKISDAARGFLMLFVYVFVEPIMLCSWGSTPGKSLLGVRLRRKDGNKLTYFEALYRSFEVWISGFGLGIPIVTLFTLSGEYKRLKKEGMTSWDRNGGFCVTHGRIGFLRGLVVVILFIGFLALMLFGSTMQNR